ncbi:MAG: hypothetical protein P1U88_13130 [Thalassobaculaceae bacterium]|nr:hypothetical protein [Thalassobaculaceae bacterium]
MTVTAEAKQFATDPVLEFHRGALPLSLIERLDGLIDKTLSLRKQPAGDGTDEVWAITVSHLMRLGVMKEPDQLLGFLRDTALADRCRELLGGDVVVSVDGTFLRDFQPSRRSVPAPFHFDAYVMGASVPMLNVWVPLSDVGERAPGLTMAKRAFWPEPYWQRVLDTVDEDGMFPRGSRADLMHTYEELMAFCRADEEPAMWSPVLSRGDVMIFDHQRMHGTQLDIEDPLPRRSIEIRVISTERERWLKGIGRPLTFMPL